MEFTTTNGHKEITITASSFREAVSLKKAFLGALIESNAFETLKANDITISATNLLDVIGKLLINIDISDSFEKAIMKCLESCVYDGKQKITEQLFDDIPELREDYYEIITKCCEVNLRPFFKSLVSELKTRFPQMESVTPLQK